MPKPFGFTKRAAVESWLCASNGRKFRTEHLARACAVTPGYASAVIRELNMNGWQIEKLAEGRNTWLRVIVRPGPNIATEAAEETPDE